MNTTAPVAQDINAPCWQQMAGKAGAYQASPNRLVSSSVLGGISVPLCNQL